jgi:hypothetical protein
LGFFIPKRHFLDSLHRYHEMQNVLQMYFLHVFSLLIFSQHNKHKLWEVVHCHWKWKLHQDRRPSTTYTWVVSSLWNKKNCKNSKMFNDSKLAWLWLMLSQNMESNYLLYWLKNNKLNTLTEHNGMDMREVLLTLFKITVAFILIMYELGVMHMLMNRVVKI